jgi:regulation of enolase protein 1 (concanavalin A-like superfamily)
VQKVLKEQGGAFTVIVGIDANHHIQEFDLPTRQVYVVPVRNSKTTTVKKRSFIQAQIDKAGLMVSDTKDHIITTCEITDYRIELVNGKQSRWELLPSDAHPYDHYIVRADLAVRSGCC